MSAPGLYATDRKTAGELETLAAKHGWKPRKLTFADLQSMSSKELNYHEQFNAENLKAAMDEPKRRAEEKTGGIKRLWSGGSTKEESDQAWATADKFMAAHPQIKPNDVATGKAFQSFFREHNLDPREYSNWTAALDTLGTEGRIALSPKLAGVGPEDELTGYALKTYTHLYKLLRPKPSAEQIEHEKVAKMGADEYKKSRPELQDGLPFVIQQQFFKAAHSLASFEPEYIFNDENNAKLIEYVNKNRLQFNLGSLRSAFGDLKKDGQLELKPVASEAQITTLTDYEPRETGQPEAPGKLRAKVARMSSSEMATFLRENPSARRAIDGM
jgi:hypothetical protein